MRGVGGGVVELINEERKRERKSDGRRWGRRLDK